MKILLILISILLFYSCGSEFDKKSELGGLRVLAIEADTPEINAAATVTLTPLISFVDGGTTTLDYSWVACPDPGIDFGASITCDDSAAALKLSGAGTFALGTLAATYNTGNATNLSIAVPGAVFTYLATLDSSTQYNGLDYLVILNYSDQGSSESTDVVKKIKLSTKSNGDLNLNPTVGNIEYKGANLVAYPTSEGEMSVSSLSASESYDFESDIGTQTLDEYMFVSWYSSTGEFLFNRTRIGEGNTFTPSGSTGVFVIIYRDSRGGVTSEFVSF